MAYLEVNNLIKSYGNNEVLHDLSFALEEGEVLSIIGKSGCGKTTLLRCLNYLEPINGGMVYIADELVLDPSFSGRKMEKVVREKRINYGLVFQSFNLFPQYTVFENIKLPLELMEKRLLKEGKEALYKDQTIDEVVEELLSKVGLLDRKDFYPGQLSGGQSQRVAIARALALKPNILCFDEPTSALDPELTGEVLKVIQEVKEKYKLTMIIVTHEMEFAKKISDKVLYMEEGNIVAFGAPNDVFNDEAVQHFVNSYSVTEGENSNEQ